MNKQYTFFLPMKPSTDTCSKKNLLKDNLSKQNLKSDKNKRFKLGLLIFGLANLFWLIIRSGTKPTRISYPCQQTALKNFAYAFGTLIPILSVSALLAKGKKLVEVTKIMILIVLFLAPISSGWYFQSTTAVPEVNLPLNSQIASLEPISNIYLVNGPTIAHINNLIDLMGENDFYFYQSTNSGKNQDPSGLFSSDDVILIKINCQWSRRGGSNTDLLKELIEVIIAHPDGFTGEIIVADNGQGRGSMDWRNTNSEDKTQSTQDVVDSFSSEYKVSTFLWDNIGRNEVSEYSKGDMDDGYVLYDSPDPESGIYVSYPKFETTFNTKISFKYGIWNGTNYSKELKVINLPVLKSHGGFGVTAAMKNYMGVQSQNLGNGHQTIATGSMGTLMVELGLPTLNILDAIWINANPAPTLSNGPSTDYREATRINMILASTDPIALDYWASKNVIYEVAKKLNHTNIHTLHPDNTLKTGISEAFGVWLNNSYSELVRANYTLTKNEEAMNIFANSLLINISEPIYPPIWLIIGVVGSGAIILISVVAITVRRIKKDIIEPNH